MPWPFLTWTPDDTAGAVYDVTVDGAWEELSAFYTGGADCAPLERVVDVLLHLLDGALVDEGSVCSRWVIVNGSGEAADRRTYVSFSRPLPTLKAATRSVRREANSA